MNQPQTSRPYLSLIQQAALAEGISIECIEPDLIYRLSSSYHSWLMLDVDIGLNDAISYQLAKSKSATYAVLAKAKIPAIPHHFLHHPDAPRGSSQVYNQAQHVFQRYQTSIVIKPDDGAQGRQVSLATNGTELQQQLERLFAKSQHAALSPFSPSQFEYRLVVLNGACYIGFSKIRSTGEWRHNLAHGAQAGKIPNHLMSELASLAQTSAEALGLRFCTVDILHTDHQGLLVLEVNGTVYLSEYVKQSSQARDKVYHLYRQAFQFKLDELQSNTTSQ